MFHISFSIYNYKDNFIVTALTGGTLPPPPHSSPSFVRGVFSSQEAAEKYVNKELDRYSEEELGAPRKDLIRRTEIDSYEGLKQLLTHVHNPEEYMYLLKEEKEYWE